MPLHRRVFGPDHHYTLFVALNLAGRLLVRGEAEEAEALYANALDVVDARLGERHPIVASVLHGLASLSELRGKPQEALGFAQDALHLRQELLGVHPDVADSLLQVGHLLAEQGETEEGERYLREALELRRELLGDRHPFVSEARRELALVQDAQ